MVDGKKRLKAGTHISVIVESLAERLGLDYELVVAEEWGQALPDGSGKFDGVIGLLQNKVISPNNFSAIPLFCISFILNRIFFDSLYSRLLRKKIL